MALPRKFWSALIEGTVYFGVGLIVAAFYAYWNGAFADHWESDAFARRWDGSCLGWSRPLAIQHLVGSLMHWWSYCTIAFVFWRLHPALKTVPYSTITLALVGWFIIGCGIDHLLVSMTIFHPAYDLEGWWLIFNGIVSMVSTVFVAFSLTRAFDVVVRIRQRAAEMEAEVKKLKDKYESDGSRRDE